MAGPGAEPSFAVVSEGLLRVATFMRLRFAGRKCPTFASSRNISQRGKNRAQVVKNCERCAGEKM
jgi:hypothetical protein